MIDIAFTQISILVFQCLIVGSLLLFLFRLRNIFGLSLLFTALGVFQYMQVFLVSSLYVEIIPGILLSPGSMVMFSGSLFALLLIYIREDAIQTRKVVYALLAANIVLALLQYIFGWAIEGEYLKNFYNIPIEFFNINARLLIVGSILLFIDAFFIIYLYELLSKITSSLFFRILIVMVIVLGIDSIFFAFGGFAGTAQLKTVLISGLIGKLSAAIIYSALFTIYLKYIDKEIKIFKSSDLPFKDIFYLLSFRKKFEVINVEKDLITRELLDKEMQFQQLFHTMAIGVVYQDKNGGIIDANPAALRILGLTMDQMQGKSSFDPDWKSIREDGTDFPGAEHPSIVALKTGKEVKDVVMGVFNILDKDYRWIKINAIPQFIEGEDGPHSVFATFDDITERKQAEEKIKISEEKFRNIFENSVVGKSMTLMDGTLQVNRAFRNILGYTQEELAKISWQSITHPDDVEFSEQKINDILSGKTESARWEKRYIHKNGEIVWVDINTSLQKDNKGNPDYFITAIYDITERKYAEKDLLISELNYKNQANFLDTIIENSPFAMWISDANGYLIRVNQVLRDTLEIPADLDITKYNILEDENFSNQGLTYILDDVFKSHKSSRFEMFWLGTETGKDNLSIPKKLWVFGSMYPITDRSGKLINVIFQYVDITERKLAEGAIKEQSYLLSKAQEIGNIGTWEFDIKKNVLTWTQENYRIFGVDEETPLTYELFLSTIYPEDRDFVDKAWNEGVKSNNYDIEHRIIVNDEVRWVREKAQFSYDDSGKPIKAIGLTQDITGYKDLTKELKENEEKFFKIFQSSPNSIILTRLSDFEIVNANEATLHITGYSLSDIIGKKQSELDVWKLEDERNLFGKQLIDKGIVKDFESEFVTKSGEDRIWKTSGEIVLINNEKYILGIIEDITDLKRANNELIRQAEFINTMTENQPAGIVACDANGELVLFNKAAKAWHGVDVMKVSQDKWAENYGLYDKDGEVMLDKKEIPLIKAFSGEAVENLEMIIKAKNQKPRSVLCNGASFYDSNGKKLGAVIVMNDITEQKLIENELIKSEKKAREALDKVKRNEFILKEMGQLAKVGGWDLDLETMTPYFTEEAYRIYELPEMGSPPKVEDGLKFYAPEAQPLVAKAVQEALENNKTYDLEVPFITAKGKNIWVRTIGQVETKNGKPSRMFGAIQDITLQKQTEETLRKSEERFRVAQEISPDGFTILHPLRNDKNEIIDFIWIYENETIARINGTNPEQVKGKRLLDLFPDHKGSSLFQTYTDVANSGKPKIIEEINTGNVLSATTWLRLVIVPMEEDIAILAQDITERKIAEEELKSSEKRFRAMIEGAPDPIFIQTNKCFAYLNKHAINLFGAKDEKELIGKPVLDFFHPDFHKAALERIKKLNDDKTLVPEPFEQILIKLNGKEVWVETKGEPLVFNNENGGLVFVRDISDRVAKEKAIENYQKSLRNMTTEISLVEEKQRKEIAENIHDHLSQSLVISKMKLNELEKVNELKKYLDDIQFIKTHISNALENSRKITYDLSPPVLYQLGIIDTMYWLADKIEDQYGIKVNFSTNIDNLKLPESTLIFVYRIIQELITNTIKHANANKIEIKFNAIANGLTIIFKDNGKGFDTSKLKTNFSRSAGFGIFAVKERVQNLNGTIKISSKLNKGIEIIIFVPLTA